MVQLTGQNGVQPALRSSVNRFGCTKRGFFRGEKRRQEKGATERMFVWGLIPLFFGNLGDL